jgi:nitrate/nitrite transporter NarK
MLLKVIGISQLFYVATVIGVLGALLMMHVGKTSFQIKGKKSQKLLSEIRNGLLIYQKKPKLCLALGAKVINTIGQFGFVIMMPIIFQAQGRGLVKWGAVWSMTFIANTLAGVLFGHLSDKLGWKKTVMYVGGPLTGIACLLILWSLYLTQSMLFVFAAFVIFGVGLADS